MKFSDNYSVKNPDRVCEITHLSQIATSSYQHVKLSPSDVGTDNSSHDMLNVN